MSGGDSPTAGITGAAGSIEPTRWLVRGDGVHVRIDGLGEACVRYP